jgi:hypothetical protein
MTATIHRAQGAYQVYFADRIYRAGSLKAAQAFCKANQFKIVWSV